MLTHRNRYKLYDQMYITNKKYATIKSARRQKRQREKERKKE